MRAILVLSWVSFSAILLLTISAKAEDTPFKINKLNQIYTKAQNSLGSSKLKDLKKDLARHEPDEIILKERKAHNSDKDGLFEASVRKKLLTILKKYSLDHIFEHVHPPINDEAPAKQKNLAQSSIENLNEDSFKIKPSFRDKKLDKLWKKAEQAGFSEEELMVLHEEFLHQQEKIDEHYETMNLMEQKLNDQTNPKPSENSLEPPSDQQEKARESPENKKARLDNNIHQELKEKYSDLKNNIDALSKKIVTGNLNDKNGPFEESIVNNLWSAAVEAKFDKFELDSLKEELEHYEIRVKKLKHFTNELERDKLMLKPSTQNTDDERDSNKRLRKRVKDLTRKVEKTHKSIEKKIASRRIEL